MSDALRAAFLAGQLAPSEGSAGGTVALTAGTVTAHTPLFFDTKGVWGVWLDLPGGYARFWQLAAGGTVDSTYPLLAGPSRHVVTFRGRYLIVLPTLSGTLRYSAIRLE